mmetsp:Transcript_43609/g.102828  ORF Transcript_43609/g.102828 Transcript_43609/m.102828 type:complete len:638 (-) Transcript_43609:70-1983(-)
MLGVYFGSFDPIHENHIAVCLKAIERGCAQVVLIANGDNPLKPDISPCWQRQSLIEERIQELDRNGQNSGRWKGLKYQKIQQYYCNAEETRKFGWLQRFQLCKKLAHQFGYETGRRHGGPGADVIALPGTVQLLGEDSFLQSYMNAGGNVEFARRRKLMIFPRSAQCNLTSASTSGNTSEKPTLQDVLTKYTAVLGAIEVASDYQDPYPELSSSRLRAELVAAGGPPARVAGLSQAVFLAVLRMGMYGAEPQLGRRVPLEQSGGGGGSAVQCHYDKAADKYGRTRKLVTDKANEHFVFNNWAKAAVISIACEMALKARPGGTSSLRVLDLGCGRGGDVAKWAEAVRSTCLTRGTHLAPIKLIYVGVDVSRSSIDIAKDRSRKWRTKVDTEFHVCDFTNASEMRDLLDGHFSEGFDIVSSQMAVHYAFKSERTATSFCDVVRLAKPPGSELVFVATTTDREHICETLTSHNAIRAGSSDAAGRRISLENKLFRLSTTSDLLRSQPVYDFACRFTLQDAVDDCEEYLVDVSALRQLLVTPSAAGASDCGHFWSWNFWSFPGCLLEDDWQKLCQSQRISSIASQPLLMELRRLAAQSDEDHGQHQLVSSPGPYQLASRKQLQPTSVEVCKLYRAILAVVP